MVRTLRVMVGGRGQRDEAYAHNDRPQKRSARRLAFWDRRELGKPARPGILRGYRAMAADEAREREAGEWVKSLIGDVADEPR